MAYKPTLAQCLQLPLGRDAALFVVGAAADYRAQVGGAWCSGAGAAGACGSAADTLARRLNMPGCSPCVLGGFLDKQAQAQAHVMVALWNSRCRRWRCSTPLGCPSSQSPPPT